MAIVRLPKFDRTKVSIQRLSEPEDELAFWLSKSIAERLEAIEISRLAIYGYDSSSARLLRLLEITQLARS